MPTVFFFCGMPTAGKTTLAKQLEEQYSAKRFTLDERMIAKTDYSIHNDEYGVLVAAEKSLIWEEAKPILENGQDVICDWSLWSRSARAEWTGRVLDAGYSYKLYFLKAPLELLKARTTARNADKTVVAHHIEHAELERFWHIFEPPKGIERIEFETILVSG
ncbi:MAG: ATP-binding protein [Chloroflexota bacterium]